METLDFGIFAFSITLAVGLLAYIFHIWRKAAVKKAEDEAQARYKDELERARVARAEARAARLNLAKPQVTTVSTETIARKYNATTPTRPAPQRTTTVVKDDSDDILTAMILQNAMNSNSDVTAGRVSWDNDTPTITPVPAETYRTPDPEPARESYSSSYSSSSSDDSSSRSSYSSSYSSSSSDSSYSSSSSDSSYSSSSD
jgi:hypothetical protein